MWKLVCGHKVDSVLLIMGMINCEGRIWVYRGVGINGTENATQVVPTYPPRFGHAGYQAVAAVWQRRSGGIHRYPLSSVPLISTPRYTQIRGASPGRVIGLAPTAKPPGRGKRKMYFVLLPCVAWCVRWVGVGSGYLRYPE